MDYVLEVSNLTKQMDHFQLDNINIALEPGYIMGLIGPNSAGKTTLLLTILGLYRPTEGFVHICGYDMTVQEKEAKSRIGFVLDENPFFENASAKENARMYGKYYTDWNQNTFEKYCKQFELDMKRPLKKLSKGNKMRFQLAFSLSHKAKLLVFDEPNAGLDPVFRRDLLEIMCDVISEEESSILYSTHLTNELDQLADYITFLQNGKQIFSLSKEELMSRYALVKGSPKEILRLDDGIVVGKNLSDSTAQALIRKNIIELPPTLLIEQPTIEDIMYYSVQSL